MGTKVTKHLEHIEEELAIVLTELPEEDQQLLVEVHLWTNLRYYEKLSLSVC